MASKTEEKLPLPQDRVESDDDDDDDEGPPPLEDLSQQVKAIRDHCGNVKQQRAAAVAEETPEEREMKRRMVGEALLQSGQLDPEETVKIVGLASASGKKLNGHLGSVVSFLHEAGRYIVSLNYEGRTKKVRIKPENLRIPEGSGKSSGGTDNTPHPSTSNFENIKAGFLEGKRVKSSTENKDTAEEDNLPYVSSGGDASNGLRIPQVQSAMSGGKADTKWVTPKLLKHLSKNKTLVEGMRDPQLAMAIQEFSENPKEALKKHGGNKKVMDFMQAFMQQTAGFNDALSNLKKKQQQQEKKQPKARKQPLIEELPSSDAVVPARSAVQRAKAPAPMTRPIEKGNKLEFSTQDGGVRSVSKETVAEWMSNPIIRQVLSKPETNQMMAHLRSDPNAFKRYAANPDLQVLIRAGIIVPPM
mmetsp:Transcript_39129/g.62695  ORF Transcript_39129/g.62695 Transcript_39129/m.62695 type:complete len:416 (-) Transcript_39129:126-1373(-)